MIEAEKAGFNFDVVKKREVKNPIFIEGLPGIGNVGKIAIDFIIENLKAEKIMVISSSHFPHSVFVNEKNLVDLPKMEIFYKNVKGKDFIFLSGDVQPVDEESCYAFCEFLLDLLQKWKAELIVTTGGIGLQIIPKSPLVYITGNSQKAIKGFKKCNSSIYGVVGPVIGVTGVLVGLAGKSGMAAVALLAQTFGHPAYIGMKGAKEIIDTLNEKFKFAIKTDKLDKDITEFEKEIKAKISPLVDIGTKKQRPMDYFG